MRPVTNGLRTHWREITRVFFKPGVMSYGGPAIMGMRMRVALRGIGPVAIDMIAVSLFQVCRTRCQIFLRQALP